MESGDPDTVSTQFHQALHPLPHLSRRLVCKGQRDDIPRIHAFHFNQPGNPVRQGPRFSCSGSRQLQTSPLCRLHSLSLNGIQAVITAHLLPSSFSASFCSLLCILIRLLPCFPPCSLLQLSSAVGTEVGAVCLRAAVRTEIGL